MLEMSQDRVESRGQTEWTPLACWSLAFATGPPVLSGEEKLKWLFSDSDRKTAANDLAGVIYKNREKGRSVLEWAGCLGMF